MSAFVVLRPAAWNRVARLARFVRRQYSCCVLQVKRCAMRVWRHMFLQLGDESRVGHLDYIPIMHLVGALPYRPVLRLHC